MELCFAPLFSGSSGNCVYVGGGHTQILIDAGVSCAKIVAELKTAGVNPFDISAILVTHEHIDHVRGIAVFAKKFGANVYLTRGTYSSIGSRTGVIPEERIRFIQGGEDFFVGDLSISAFSTPHDAAESVGYTISGPGGATFALATDVGSLKQGWQAAVHGAQAVLLESNYDTEMLKAGPYPYELKRRILSKNGHLSNDDAASETVELIKAGARTIVLGHLSKENNYPELALRSCLSAIATASVSASDVLVARRDGLTGVFTVLTND